MIPSDPTRTLHSMLIDGSPLSVVEEGDGPAVLLGHGFLWDWAMWEPQLRALRPHCRLIIPELWGHGGSGPLPGGTRSLADIADQMLAALDMLGIQRCVVVGSSVGGMWGAHLAARAPARVAGLVMLNSYLGKEPEPQRLAYAGLLDQVHANGEVSPATMAAVTPLFFAATVEARSPGLPSALRAQLRRFGAQSLRDSIVPLGRMIFDRPDDLQLLSDIGCPTLLVAGAEDRARPAAESQEMADRLKAELVVIPACGHTATLEQPVAVNKALLEFLRQRDWLA